MIIDKWLENVESRQAAFCFLEARSEAWGQACPPADLDVVPGARPPADDGKLPSLPFPVFQGTITGWLRALLPKSRRARLFEVGCQIGLPVPVCRVSISLNDVSEAHPLGYAKEKPTLTCLH